MVEGKTFASSGGEASRVVNVLSSHGATVVGAASDRRRP
jgi:hypothetical protein